MDTISFERGRFYVGPNGPRFAGSASGVYLADTVRSQVSPSSTTAPGPSGAGRSASPGIEQAFIARSNNTSTSRDAGDADLYGMFVLKVSDLTEADKIRDALEHYFTTWHPLFPFLDGGYMIECLENAVTAAKLVNPGSDMSVFPGLGPEQAMVLSAIFRAILAIASIGDGDNSGLPTISSSTQAGFLAHLVTAACQGSSVSDVFAIQALIAILLYYYASRSLRPAMLLSGTVTKLAFEAGLHRCPDRYLSTFTDSNERAMRKRVFWSLYVLDRLLTAEFGIPIMLHDTDIDTCVPGARESHPACPPSPPGHPARTPGGTELPSSARKRPRTNDLDTPIRNGRGRSTTAPPSVVASVRHFDSTEASHQPPEPLRSRLLPAYSLVGISRIVGRAMEVFNKSLQHRSLDPQETMQLRTELERWWNDIGFDSPEDLPDSDPRSQHKILLTCLYHHQIINLHRPALSLAPSALQHAYALQTCVASARVICATLAGESGHEELLWPGYVDMVFFSALILVYGNKRDAAIGTDNPQRLKGELRRAVQILQPFQSRWGNLRPFIRALETLMGANPSAADENTSANNFVPPAPSGLPSDANDQLFDSFLFDFNTFELNPELNWAFHMSMPGSPVP